ncbi:hypothetical protein Mettu_4392 [Methylobacter tundripaludum SV96]|uniref:Uncharacterized protein n=1 Tax=Methylobacter tundripaludum (strain ATCC BAA-1195 / DSM 17260 / SV96) TaxID=697282 RepID=G3IYS6_METTV|nr:hypothetical protein Mettu_4392 [Methylobacter tundripaludum SV96]
MSALFLFVLLPIIQSLCHRKTWGFLWLSYRSLFPVVNAHLRNRLYGLKNVQAAAQKKQDDYEAIASTFADRHYIRAMEFCRTCNGSGCNACSGHGWRHTSVSIAFGRGLNSMITDSNPYKKETAFNEMMAWGRGYKITQLAEGARVAALIRQAIKAGQ